MKTGFIKQISGLGLVAGLLFGSAMEASAQSANPGPNFGIKGGVNFAQLFVDQPNAEDESMKIGYHFGIFAKAPISDFIAIQPEVLYTNVGSKITYGGSNLETLLGIQQGEVRFNLNYIQVPVSLVVNIGPFAVHAGPYVSYLVGANVKDLKASTLNTTNVADLNRDNFNKLDYGLVGGLGFDVGPVTVGARYNYGLREIGQEGLAGNLTNNSRNSVAQIYLGFGI